LTGKQLLVIHPGALGDMVLTFPAILKLRARFPRIFGICQGNTGRMAVRLKVLDRHLALESATCAGLYSGNPDRRLQEILDACTGIILFSLSQIPEQTLRKNFPRPVYRILPRPEPGLRVHVSRHIADQLLQHGLIDNTQLPVPEIQRSGSRKIWIHPGSGSLRKNWPFKNFLMLFGMLCKEGLEPAFIMGPAEKERMFPEISGFAVYSPPNLAELADLLVSGGGFIGNDSGVTHLAAFLGLPTASIFGPSDPERWHPQGHSITVIRAEGTDCAPCFEVLPDNCREAECLGRISPERILEAILQITKRALGRYSSGE